MRLKLRDLVIFDAVVRQGSIQGAADAVGVTQSAVTRVIQRLELDLGHTLLDRTNRPLRLTADGDRAIAYARDVLSAVEEMEAAFGADGVASGTFRLGLSHALTHLLLDAQDLLGLKAFPELKPSFVSGWSEELLASLGAQTLHGAITLSRNTGDDPGAAVLASSPIHVVSNQENADQARDLLQANKIGWALNPSGCGYRRALFAALEEGGEAPNVVLETNSLELQLAFARDGRAMTLAPDFLQKLSPSADGLSFTVAEGLTTPINVLLHRADGATSFVDVFHHVEERIRTLLS